MTRSARKRANRNARSVAAHHTIENRVVRFGTSAAVMYPYLSDWRDRNGAFTDDSAARFCQRSIAALGLSAADVNWPLVAERLNAATCGARIPSNRAYRHFVGAPPEYVPPSLDAYRPRKRVTEAYEREYYAW